MKKSEPRRKSTHRELVLRCISSAGGKHLSAEQIFDEVRKTHPDIGVATVYRNLKQLEETGIITKSPVGQSAALYELAQTDGGHSHHHLVCTGCGKVEDLETDLLEDIESFVDRKKGFEVSDHRLQIFGLCRSCRKIMTIGK